MLFFFTKTTDNICSSLYRVVLLLVSILFICCHAYPYNSNNYEDRQWVISSEEQSDYLQRNVRGTGFYIIRQGDYLVLIPDSKHHFTKNMRPYIGRRRR